MTEKVIGKKNNGIKMKIFDGNRLTIWELMEGKRSKNVNLFLKEAKDLKKFIDDELK